MKVPKVVAATSDNNLFQCYLLILLPLSPLITLLPILETTFFLQSLQSYPSVASCPFYWQFHWILLTRVLVLLSPQQWISSSKSQIPSSLTVSGPLSTQHLLSIIQRMPSKMLLQPSPVCVSCPPPYTRPPNSSSSPRLDTRI